MSDCYVTYKFRVKDSSAKRWLKRHAIACNQVWNFCVATQREAQRRWNGGKTGRWPSAYDLGHLTAGSSAELETLADTIEQVCKQFVVSRNAQGKCPKFRSSFGRRRSLGWVPFRFQNARVMGDGVKYRGRVYKFWKSREIVGEIRRGAFVQDARGRWYVTFVCRVEAVAGRSTKEVGIDLGLKSLATCSDGEEIPALRLYRAHEAELARAQRARNYKRVRAISAKIANARAHYLHNASTKLANENSLIVVGNVSASSLKQTRMAKSVSDAGWSMFRNMLRYKSARRQAVYIEADERFSSQTCSDCGSVSGPKGLKGLGVRRWECVDCGASHDRDHNAAKLILASGRNVALQQTEVRKAA